MPPVHLLGQPDAGGVILCLFFLERFWIIIPRGEDREVKWLWSFSLCALPGGSAEEWLELLCGAGKVPQAGAVCAEGWVDMDDPRGLHTELVGEV